MEILSTPYSCTSALSLLSGSPLACNMMCYFSYLRSNRKISQHHIPPLTTTKYHHICPFLFKKNKEILCCGFQVSPLFLSLTPPTPSLKSVSYKRFVVKDKVLRLPLLPDYLFFCLLPCFVLHDTYSHLKCICGDYLRHKIMMSYFHKGFVSVFIRLRSY